MCISYIISDFTKVNTVGVILNFVFLPSKVGSFYFFLQAGTPIEGFTEESNDDAIIHAALSLKLRACHSNVVLFSNDRNLCNKCIVAGIKAFSQQVCRPVLLYR